MRSNPYVVAGLRRAGFTGGWLDARAALDPPAWRPARSPAVLAAAGAQPRAARRDPSRCACGRSAARARSSRELVPEFERAQPRHPRRRAADPVDRGAREAADRLRRRIATPDVAQLGNTWIPEFAAIGALEPLDAARRGVAVARGGRDYFPGIWETNVLDGALYGVPWYVDTRVLFYRARPARGGRVPEAAARRGATWRRRDARRS